MTSIAAPWSIAAPGMYGNSASAGDWAMVNPPCFFISFNIVVDSCKNWISYHNDFIIGRRDPDVVYIYFVGYILMIAHNYQNGDTTQIIYFSLLEVLTIVAIYNHKRGINYDKNKRT